ncbi:efflux RND transporter periplasmic adaptor subunit [Methylovirgula sp. 4M-Z18]|uniref:efflux RND transporter periplasmic adaptor subunit n=2 Tax=Methylovirgula sp. 4M-Z18 TaxID=2293567 RepID=UPI0030D3FD60
MIKRKITAVGLLAISLTGCHEDQPSPPEARPVRTVTIERRAEGETVSLIGQIRAKDQVSLAFRLDGRMIERPVHVGDVLTVGQIVAKLDPENQENALRSAQATLTSANAQLTQARLNFARVQQGVKDEWASHAQFEAAQESLSSTQAQVDSAQAQENNARDQLGYAVLSADAPGSVTAVGAEPGEVVHAGQMVVQVARQGGLDAVFDVPEELIRTGPRDPAVEIALTQDPQVRATGRVREVAPEADAATRTFQIKVGIANPPETLRLGATVTGRIKLSAPAGVEVPASALTEANGHPAVWVVDPKSQTVSLRNVVVLRYDPASLVISQGLENGEFVVTAGIQTLFPGQKVRLLGDNQ